ncbi:MAG TPA: hypothetical protein VGD78_09845, partial [Chthoniobacterales bacterium]
RRATVESIWWDAVQGGYRVRFHVFDLRPGDEWSTVQTDPPVAVGSTRWRWNTVEVMTRDDPPWQVGAEVLLTLQPYW